MVDILIGYSHFFTIKSFVNASQVEDLIFKDIFRLHGLPKNIFRNIDNRFLGSFWNEIFHFKGIDISQHNLSSSK